MKKLYTFLMVMLIALTLWAQTPQRISYQAVIRNASNELVTSTEVGMRISILQGSADGTAVYTETLTPTTNANGLVALEFGGGTGFDAIDWANGSYFIKTETDPTGGNNYTITGATKLLSVPYALHANTAETFTGTLNETDPAVTANFDFTDAANGDLLQFNGTKWVKVTPDYISDYTVTETDVTAHQAALTVTESQISDLSAYIETETDPAVTANFDFTDAANGDLLQFNGTKWVKVTPDYAAGTHSHATATDVADGFMSSADKTKLDDLQNVNISAGTGISVTGTYPNQTIASSHTLYLGQEYLDGIIFYLYIGSDGQQHGLVVSKTETTAQWQSTTSTTNANRTEDGEYNTGLMSNSPAKTWVTGLGAGWYLPSVDELSLLWHNRFHVNKTARAISSTLLSTTADYWSSTEHDAASAFAFYFYGGYADGYGKTETCSVRAVRAF